VAANGDLHNSAIADSDSERIAMEIYYPPRPGSVYHMTKVLDAQMFEYYNRNDHIRITDLHQGIVWGTNTAETLLDERLVNRFDYDGDYGTVLNRLLMQAAIGYPLTVYGTGGQTRAFIHIRDSVRCVEIAVANPPSKDSRVLIFNQMTETHTVRYLAKLVSTITGVPIDSLHNPRNEAAENGLEVENAKFLALGLKPTKLDGGLLAEVMEIAKKYSCRCNLQRIKPTSFWTAAAATAGTNGTNHANGTNGTHHEPNGTHHMNGTNGTHDSCGTTDDTYETISKAITAMV